MTKRREKKKSVGLGKGRRAWESGFERGSVAFALIFWLLLDQAKSDKAPAAIERSPRLNEPISLLYAIKSKF